MIKGAVELLREGKPGPRTPAQARFLQVVDHQSSQVIGLCESLLIQAKIEAGVFPPASMSACSASAATGRCSPTRAWRSRSLGRICSTKLAKQIGIAHPSTSATAYIAL